MKSEETSICECDNCGDQSQPIPLNQCEGLAERLDADGVVPSGECPVCGAFMYKKEIQAK